jgi:hypothetical protein
VVQPIAGEVRIGGSDGYPRDSFRGFLSFAAGSHGRLFQSNGAAFHLSAIARHAPFTTRIASGQSQRGIPYKGDYRRKSDQP